MKTPIQCVSMWCRQTAVTALLGLSAWIMYPLPAAAQNVAPGAGYHGCLELHNTAGPGTISYWRNKCQVHLIYKYWVPARVAAAVGNPGTCSRTQKCGGSINPGDKVSEFDYHGIIHVAACKYPDSPIDDADGIGYRCPLHTASDSPPSQIDPARVAVTVDPDGRAAITCRTKADRPIRCDPATLKLYPGAQDRFAANPSRQSINPTQRSTPSAPASAQAISNAQEEAFDEDTLSKCIAYSGPSGFAKLINNCSSALRVLSFTQSCLNGCLSTWLPNETREQYFATTWMLCPASLDPKLVGGLNHNGGQYYCGTRLLNY